MAEDTSLVFAALGKVSWDARGRLVEDIAYEAWLLVYAGFYTCMRDIYGWIGNAGTMALERGVHDGYGKTELW